MVDEPDCFEGQRRKIDTSERVEEGGLDHHEPGAGILEDVAQLQPTRGNVDRHETGAEPGATEEYLDEFRSVLAHKRHAIARLDPFSSGTVSEFEHKV